MAKNSFTFSSKIIPWGLLGGLVLIIAFEATVAYLDPQMYPPPFDGLRMKIKNEISRTADQNFAVLIMGDCFNIHGVDALTLEQKTDLSTFNFASHAAQTVFSSYIMLQNYLKINAPPEYIIISYLPESFVYRKELLLRDNLPHLYDFISGNQTAFVHEFGWPQTLKFMLPSLKQQPFLRTRLWSDGLVPRERIRKFEQSVHKLRGYYRPGKIVYRPQPYLNSQPYRQPVSPFFDKYLKKIFNLAGEHDIQVIYTMFTAPPQIYEMYAGSGLTARYFAYFNDIRRTYPAIRFLNPQPFLKENHWYLDSTHLNQTGAQRFTEFLIEVLQSTP